MKTYLFTLLVALFAFASCMPQENPSVENLFDQNAMSAPQGFNWSSFRSVQVEFEPLKAPVDFSALFTVSTPEGVVLYQALQPANDALRIEVAVPAQIERLDVSFGSLSVNANARQSSITFNFPVND
ncbi:hypothetical protein A3SI_13208 [Nitritalea halalkaliphila LW7]|uniref:Lipoprotein n=1 Tax=Nitritalea halalkaliphila LW7 TaxID=1189621 RepID=I5C193_9BACT|nr:hypothetical protein [Nitritalea halalkaliphila]EIM75595.1 hypothetical protein A3SI_13208 [Nitritalea halalkaliphila LW7]